MSLKIGIVGLPNAGKSTLFNALVKRQLAKVAEYPFTTIKPYEGVIDVPDERLVNLTLMVKPKKSTPASVTFVDLAGLVKGAYKGEGLGNEFLSHIREVSAILHLVRAFECPLAVHTLGTVDPKRDIEIVNTELLLKDLETVGKILKREKDKAKKTLLLKVKNALNKGRPACKLQLNSEERKQVRQWQLLSEKPMFYVLNVSEKELAEKKIASEKMEDKLIICAKLESDLTTLSPSEQQEYLYSLGISSSGLEKIIKKAYFLLHLITFFTIKGGREVRAWPVKRGTSALKAAEMVHTDMARGFIKAQTISYKDLLACTSWTKASEQGKIRLEGRDYLISDGDVVEFKFQP